MIADSLCALVALSGFLVLFYGPWQSVCTDVARQLMFEQRDKIFDMARSGVIEFDSREYRRVRISIEQNIRYAHELTFAKLVAPNSMSWFRRAPYRRDFCQSFGDMRYWLP